MKGSTNTCKHLDPNWKGNSGRRKSKWLLHTSKANQLNTKQDYRGIGKKMTKT